MGKYSITALTLVFALAILANTALADTLTQSVDRLNFQTPKNHNVTLSWVGATPVTITATIPASFVYVSGSASCSNISATQVSCTNIANGGTASYVIASPAVASEYTTYQLAAVSNTTIAATNITLVRINDNEVFYTLIEYGRGRGNYFYSTSNKAKGLNLSSNYIPESSDMELSFLHKILNIGRYIGIPIDTATEANFTCQYPDKTVVRQHNVLTMTRANNIWNTVYNVEEIETSWERMGYLSMQIDSGEYSAGSNVQINCTGVLYAIDSGKVVVDSDNFTLSVVSRQPIAVNAYPAVATVSNGTTEVEVTYEITNTQSYGVTEVAIEIQAPESASFIGTRGELWGTSAQVYRLEFSELGAGESRNITLVARFDTAAQPAGDTTLLASNGVRASFVVPWEMHAYNPAEYVQDVVVSQTLTWNQAATSTIANIPTMLSQINSTVNTINTLVTEINSTAHSINSTATEIKALVTEINLTTWNITNTLQETVIPNLETIKGYTAELESLINSAIDLMDCTNATASSVCDRLYVLNTTVNSIQVDTTQIITDVTNLNSNMGSNFTQVYNRFAEVDGNLTAIRNFLASMNVTLDIANMNTVEIIKLLDCTNSSFNTVCNKLDNITNLVAVINTNVTLDGNLDEILNITRYLNDTRWGNYTAADLYTAIQNLDFTSVINQLNANTTEILKRIRLSKEFSEEMVFLITDSVNSQVIAANAVKTNDFETAVQQLQNAEAKLNDANTLLLQKKAVIETQTTIPIVPITLVGIVVALGACGIYYKRKEQMLSSC